MEVEHIKCPHCGEVLVVDAPSVSSHLSLTYSPPSEYVPRCKKCGRDVSEIFKQQAEHKLSEVRIDPVEIRSFNRQGEEVHPSIRDHADIIRASTETLLRDAAGVSSAARNYEIQVRQVIQSM